MTMVALLKLSIECNCVFAKNFDFNHIVKTDISKRISMCAACIRSILFCYTCCW